MRNFKDTFKTCKRSFISVFSICMTVPSYCYFGFAVHLAYWTRKCSCNTSQVSSKQKLTKKAQNITSSLDEIKEMYYLRSYGKGIHNFTQKIAQENISEQADCRRRTSYGQGSFVSIKTLFPFFRHSNFCNFPRRPTLRFKEEAEN